MATTLNVEVKFSKNSKDLAKLEIPFNQDELDEVIKKQGFKGGNQSLGGWLKKFHEQFDKKFTECLHLGN